MQSSVFRINTFSRRISLPWNQSQIKIIANRPFSRYLASFLLGNFFDSNVLICLSNKPQTKCSLDRCHEDAFLANFWPNGTRTKNDKAAYRNPHKFFEVKFTADVVSSHRS